MKKVITGVRQIGFVVEDLEAVLKYYSEELGFTEWTRFVMDEEALKACPHLTHGKPLPISFKGAKGMVGNIEFEFMQPVSDNTIYAEFLKENKPGMHHLYVEVTDFDEAYAEFSSKYEVIQTAITPFGTKIAYFDSFKELGYGLEIGLRNFKSAK